MRPNITLQGSDVLIDIPLSTDGLARRAPTRRIVVTCEAIRDHLGVDSSRMNVGTYTGFVRNHLPRLERLAEAKAPGDTYVRLERGEL